MNRILSALVAVVMATLSFAPTPAPASVAFTAQSNSQQCTTRGAPFPAGYYPRVVITADSIAQRGTASGVQPSNASFNPAVAVSVTTTSGSPIVTYNGSDVATLGLYYNQAISGTGLAGSILGALDSTHFLMSAPSIASGTISASLANPANSANASQTIGNIGTGELVTTQSLAPYFRFDQWNDQSRSWGAPGNPAANSRGGNMGYGGSTVTNIAQRMDEVKALNPDILVVAIGANNLTLPTFGQETAALVDSYHAWCPQMGIILANVRATGVGGLGAPARTPGSVVFDNSLIQAIAAARPWVKYLDLFSLTATNGATGAQFAIINASYTSGGNLVTLPAFPGDPRQSGAQVGQTVTGTDVPASTTISAVTAAGIQLSNALTATKAGAGSITVSPGWFANQTGIDATYQAGYPSATPAPDFIHPSLYGAMLTSPTFASAICAYRMGGCPASAGATSGNVFLDTAGTSLLGSSPSPTLAGAGQAVSHSYASSGGAGVTGVWASGATQLTSVTGSPAVGQIVGGGNASFSANTFITAVSGSTVTISNPTLGSNGSTGGSFTLIPGTQTTGTWSNGSTSMTVNSASGLTAGMAIGAATGLPVGETIASVSGTTVTLTLPATAAGSSAAVTATPAVVGTSATGIDVSSAATQFSSAAVSLVSNSETGGNMASLAIYPAGTKTGETFTLTPTPIASTGCAGQYCRLWAELEVDQNAGWVSASLQAKERNSVYANLYIAFGATSLVPSGSGTRRFWVHTECFAYPANSTGIAPTIALTLAPSLTSSTATANLRRLDLRTCPAPAAYWKVGANDNKLLRGAA